MAALDTAGLADPWTSPKGALRFIWRQLDRRAQHKVLWATAALAVLSVADFVAVLMIAGVTGYVVATFTTSWSPPALSWLQVQDVSPLTLIAVLGGGAVILLALKTFVSWRLLRRVYLFIARLQPVMAGRVYQSYLHAPYPAAQMLSRAQVTGAIGTGASSLLMALRSLIAMVADFTLIALMVALMLLASPLLFLGSAAYFGLLAFVTSRFIGRRMSYYGREGYQAALAANETAQASVGFASEIRLYGMARDFGERLARDQLRAATLSGLQQVMFQAPRYVFEMGVLIGFVAVAAISFVVQSPADAAFTVALFSLTSVRLVPALQRLNGAWGTLRLGKAQSYALLPILRLPPASPIVATQFAEDLANAPEPRVSPGVVLRLSDVSYQYPATDEWALRDVDLTIARGSMVALVGRTGSGKSTLAGVLAGLIEPTSGQVQRADTTNWRDRLAVVPQDVYLAPDSVRNNIALPVLGQAEDDGRVWEALSMAQVADVVEALPGCLDAQLGEDGARVSGGEAQRLGLARALYRKPDLLILDEATSSLDAQTERLVADAVRAASQECTMVVIAHRLATVREADHVVFLESGRILAQGTFAEVAQAVPAFAEAAKLQGLGEFGESNPPLDPAADRPVAVFTSKGQPASNQS